MLSDRIKTVLDTMDITITDVARAGGCTPSNLSRVKNGIRIPPPTSPTISCLTEGMIEIARQKNLTGELRILCSATLRDNDEILRAKLINWLYEDEPPYTRTYQKHKSSESAKDRKIHLSASFSRQLDQLMKAVGLSNRKLGKESGLDPSYISRLRRGERIPRYHSSYLIKICTALRTSIIEEGKLSAVAELTGITSEDLSEKDSIDVLRRWLFGTEDANGYLAAEELKSTIASIDGTIEAASSKPFIGNDSKDFLKELQKNEAETDCPDEQRYVGIEGIQSAVTRLLTEMIRNDDKELLLYSDQSMDWMNGDYRLILKVLMIELIRRDVKIRIIHTVDRSMTELVIAIAWWMPLYLSGKITSYYCLNNAGKRFSHTLFIRPGEACISGTSAIGLESRAVYHYTKDSDMIRLAQDAFDSILKDSLPLIQISEYDYDNSEAEGFVRIGKLDVNIMQKKVVLQRIEPPYLMFAFTHPMICRAFRAYMNTLT